MKTCMFLAMAVAAFAADGLAVGAEKGPVSVVVVVGDQDVKVNRGLRATEPDLVDTKACRFEPPGVLLQAGQLLAIQTFDIIGPSGTSATAVCPT